jgi:hypothetical protein
MFGDRRPGTSACQAYWAMRTNEVKYTVNLGLVIIKQKSHIGHT